MKYKKPIFIYSTIFKNYRYPRDHIFTTQRAFKTRNLLKSLGLLDGACGMEKAPRRATESEITRFHTPVYLRAVKEAAAGKRPDQRPVMGLGTSDCPIFKDMFAYAAWSCGATLTGAEMILAGDADIVFNPSGGFHHAQADRASGFCYFNDLVLSCLRFVDQGKKVLYLDLDAHHGDGVQNAFYRSDKVLMISLHESGKTLFPYSGFENEIGEGDGRGFTINIPMPVGTCDKSYLRAFENIVVPIIPAFKPDVFVLQLGMDALAGDALAHLELSNNAHAEIVARIMRYQKPILATGGGGYHVEHTIRSWALMWEIMCGRETDEELAMGLGGTLLQSTEWAGGLRDRTLATNDSFCREVDAAIDKTTRYLRHHIFPLHAMNRNDER